MANLSICLLPPEGWKCSRAPGHTGPCAAYPTQPYRSSQKPELTDGELAFWERTFTEVHRTAGTHTAERLADEAVEIRRRKFGVR